MDQIIQAARRFFILAGIIKRQRASRLEFWVGFWLFLSAMFFRILLFQLVGVSQAETPIWLLGAGAAFTVLFVVPFATLSIRRLQDAGLSGWLFAVIIILLLVFSPAALVCLIVLGALPTRNNAKNLLVNDSNPNMLSDNPIIGFRIGRLMKMLALVIGLPIVLILLLGLASTILE